MNWVTGVTLLVVTPTPIRDVSRETGGTTVQRKRLGLIERLHHEAMRPIYRAQALRRSTGARRGRGSSPFSEPAPHRRGLTIAERDNCGARGRLDLTDAGALHHANGSEKASL